MTAAVGGAALDVFSELHDDIGVPADVRLVGVVDTVVAHKEGVRASRVNASTSASSLSPPLPHPLDKKSLLLRLLSSSSRQWHSEYASTLTAEAPLVAFSFVTSSLDNGGAAGNAAAAAAPQPAWHI
jgi:hypothetical protein